MQSPVNGRAGCKDGVSRSGTVKLGLFFLLSCDTNDLFLSLLIVQRFVECGRVCGCALGL